MFYSTLEFITKSGKKGEIRSVRVEESAKIIEVRDKIYTETEFLIRRPGDPMVSLYEEEQYVSKVMDSKTDCLLGAYVDGELVGIGGINMVGQNKKVVAHRATMGISILKDYWNDGIGSRLLEAIIELGIRVGYEQIELEVVTENERAIKLYEKYGFRIYGTRPHAMKEEDGRYKDEHLMVKELIGKFEPEEKSTDYLADWIEEQGIQLRY